jgi:hypothetical protein
MRRRSKRRGLSCRECAPTREQEERVIKAVLDAGTHVEVLRELAADRKTKKMLLGLKEKAAALHAHFRRQGPLHSKIELLRSLDRAQRLLEDEIKELSEKIGSVTREFKTPAGRRVLFMIELSKAIVDIFGKHLNAVVAALTDVALEWPGGPEKPTTAEHVAQARWRHAERGQNLHSERKKGAE